MACRLRASRLSLSHWTKGRMFSEISGHGHRCGVGYCSRNSEENLKACRTLKSISTVCLTCCRASHGSGRGQGVQIVCGMPEKAGGMIMYRRSLQTCMFFFFLQLLRASDSNSMHATVRTNLRRFSPLRCLFSHSVDPLHFPLPLGCLSGAQPFSTAQSASSSVSSLCRGKKVDSIVFSLTAATQTSSVNFEGTWTNWAPTLHRGHTRCRRILPISSLFVYFDTPSRSQI